MKPGWILICCIASVAIGHYSNRFFETRFSDEKLVFKQDDVTKQTVPVANLMPNGVLCINIPLLAKSDSPKKDSVKNPVPEIIKEKK